MELPIFVVSCAYTAEYGAPVIDYQNAYAHIGNAIESLVDHIEGVYHSVGGEIVDDDKIDEIREYIETHHEYRHDWGDGNHYVWTLNRALLIIDIRP